MTISKSLLFSNLSLHPPSNRGSIAGEIRVKVALLARQRLAH